MLYQLSKLGGVSRALPAADTASRASGSGRQMARRFVAEARCQAPQQEIYRPGVGSVRWTLPARMKKETASFRMRSFVFALPIFTASHPATIVGVRVLNFCVRDGNRWTHTTINTNSIGWLQAIFICQMPKHLTAYIY